MRLLIFFLLFFGHNSFSVFSGGSFANELVSKKKKKEENNNDEKLRELELVFNKLLLFLGVNSTAEIQDDEVKACLENMDDDTKSIFLYFSSAIKFNIKISMEEKLMFAYYSKPKKLINFFDQFWNKIVIQKKLGRAWQGSF